VGYNIVLIVPSLVFVLSMVSQARRIIIKLTHARSSIIASYYAVLYVVILLNILWCLLQVWKDSPGKATAWNVLSLVTIFGMLLLEVSVLVFLLQGSYVSGWDALMHTLILSTTIASVDTIIKSIYIFGFGVPLFVDNNDTGDWQKWGFWLAYKLVFVAIYASILCLPHTKWHNRLPGIYIYF